MSTGSSSLNGAALTLSLVGALALGAAVGKRGSRSGRWVYHLTYRSDLPSIARQGLTPRSDTQEAWDNEPGVYFVNTFGYEAGAPESEEPAWLRLPAPHALPASFWTSSLQEGHTLISFPPDAIEVWVDAEGRPAAKADGVAWKPLREFVHVKRGSRTTDPTSTPAFRRWFGESKVVDEAGRPLVVYHGTTAGGFDAFRPNYRKGEQLGFGIHFAHDRSVAELYADPGRAGRKEGSAPKVYEVYLSLRNPIDFTQRTFIEGTPEFGVMNDLLQQVFEGDTDHLYEQDGNGVRLLDTAYRNYLDALPGPMVERTLRDVGFDGVIYNALILGERRRRAIAYIAFRPEQIKSATGNRGTFDPADPRISYNRSAR